MLTDELIDLRTQRLWLLERRAANHRHAVDGFAGAVAVLADDGVYLVVVRSHDRQRASDIALRDGAVRVQLERDGYWCATLSDALMTAERLKRDWLARGWTTRGEDVWPA